MKINMKILLVCNAGMSTGIMKMKLEQEAKIKRVRCQCKMLSQW